MVRIACLALVCLMSACAPVQDAAEQLDFDTCADVVRSLAKNPSRAEIPRVRPYDHGLERVGYEWRRGAGLSMQNGFGAMIDTTASCILQRGELHTLVVNGRQVGGDEFRLLALQAATFRARRL